MPTDAHCKSLLIVVHRPSANLSRLAEATLAATLNPLIEGVRAILKTPAETDAEAVLACDGLILGTSENFGYMAGALKDFFERTYYPCLEQTRGKPYALWVRAGQDGQGAKQSVERIVTGLGWHAVQPALIMRGEWQEEFVDQVSELSLTVAAGLDAGIY